MQLTEPPNYDIFSGINLELLPRDEKKLFDDSSVIIHYKKNDIVYDSGSMAKGAYYITRGMVKVNQYASDAKEEILFFFSCGEMFGCRALLTNDKHSVSAVCIEDCEIKFIESSKFLKLIESSEILTRQLLSRVSNELTLLLNRINILAQKDDKGRLAFALLVLNEKCKAQKKQIGASLINISLLNLSAFTKLSVDLVSKNLNYFAEINAIKIINNTTLLIENFDYLYNTSVNLKLQP